MDVKTVALDIAGELCAAEQLIGEIAGQVIRAATGGGHTAANVVGELSNHINTFEKELRK